MVTNTGTSTETASVKENGDCANDNAEKDNLPRNEVSSLKQSTVDDSGNRSSQAKTSGVQNDTVGTMPNSQNEKIVRPDLGQASTANGLPSTSNTPFNRSYGNGVSTSVPNASINGPPQGQNTAYAGYGSYPHGSTLYMQKGGPRPHGGSMYPPQRYPTAGPTPTLNQLLTTPSRYTNQPQSGYTNYVGGQQPSDYQQGLPPHDWQARAQQVS